MPKLKPWYLALAIVGFLIVGGMGGQARAASSPSSPLGITVSPAFQSVSLAQNVSAQPVTFTLTNNKSSSQALTLSVADFNALNESGGLFFVGTNPTALQAKYGLAKWVELPYNQLTLLAHQTVKFQADILNLSTLTGGGHYGALMVSLNNSENASSANRVGLQPIASSLLFVTKLDGATYNLSLSGVNFSHYLFSLPKSVSLNFQNLGNSHVVPRGTVSLISPSGKLIAKGIINQNSGLILPGKSRYYNVALSSVSHSLTAGSYKLMVAYRFDGYNGYRLYQTSFWLLASWQLALIVIFAIAALLIARLVFKKPPTKLKNNSSGSASRREIPIHKLD